MEVEKNKFDIIFNDLKPEEIFKPQGQVKFYLEEQPLFYDENCLWWIWNRELKKWKITDEVEILNAIEKITGKDIITPKNRTLILNSLKQECRKTIPKPIAPTWIQFKDKIFDIKTGETFEAIPDYFVTNPIPYKLHNNNYELTPTIDRIFEEWVGKDYVQTLHEIIAYCLLPNYPIHRLFCFVGAGLNGKSSFLRLLEKFIGSDNVTTTELDILLKSRFEVTRLHKKLVCLMGETNFNVLNKTSIIKRLTGQDTIGFEYKNKNPFTDNNYAKIIISTNSLPVTSDKTLGFYRRWCIIDFPNQFSEEKDILEDIPEEEYESLALKCTTILHNLLKARKFTNEGSIEQRTKKYEERSNPMSLFIKENYTKDVNAEVLFSDFFDGLNEFLQEKGHRMLNAKVVGVQLKNDGYTVKVLTKNGVNGRFVLGIKPKIELLPIEVKDKLIF